jgi:hypothetical protein
MTRPTSANRLCLREASRGRLVDISNSGHSLGMSVIHGVREPRSKHTVGEVLDAHWYILRAQKSKLSIECKVSLYCGPEDRYMVCVLCRGSCGRATKTICERETGKDEDQADILHPRDASSVT